MKKLFSAILAAMLVLSTFSFVVSAAGDPVVVSPSQLDVNVDANASMTRDKNATKDGISVIKMTPKASSSDDFKVDGYNIGSRNVDLKTYKYVSMDYYYETSDTSSSNAVLSSKAMLLVLQLKAPVYSREVYSAQNVEANKWTRLTFDLSAISNEMIAGTMVNTSDGTTIKQYHLYPLGKETNGNSANGTIYINNLTFHTAPVGIPTITGVRFAENEIEIEKGYSMPLPGVTVLGENSPIQDYTITVAGHASAKTKLDGKTLSIGADETAETITVTATSVIDPSKTATLTVKVKNPAPRTEFDEDNVVLRFGVVSDVHQNGYYAGKGDSAQVQEWSHVVDVFQNIAKDDGAALDAILVAGDMTDGVANGGSNAGSFNTFGDKAIQNMREVGHFAKGIWGKNTGVEFTGTRKVINETTTAPNGYNTATSVNGFGNGFDATTKLFYALGNHDESGRGKTTAPKKSLDGTTYQFSTVYSADYFAAIICGWHHNPDSAEAKANVKGGTGASEDGFEHSYRQYIADLIDYNTNPATTVTKAAFEAAYGVKLESADSLFDKYYGHLDVETTLTDKANGLSFGNMHMTIDPDKTNDTTDDRIHFIAVELSESNESCAWAEKIIKTSIDENPNKPIFVITHYKMPNAMYGSDNGGARLHEVVKNYPQVIIWGGHSHTTMHNDNAINTDGGYVAVETNTTRYLGTSSALTMSSKYGAATVNNSTQYPHTPFNYSGHEAAVSNGVYTEMDKNFNVRLKRVDIYRSYSTDFAENPSFFTQSKYKNFNSHAYNKEFKAIDAPAFIRKPWDITDIGTGKHLSDFSTTKRTNDTAKPYFESTANTLSATPTIGGLDVTFKMNAKDDGMVMLYVLEVKDGSGNVAHRRYYTNFYYEYPQNPTATYAGNMMPESQIVASIAGLNPATEYSVELFAMDDFYVRGDAISVKATTKDGNTKITLDDGRIGVFVDTTGKNAEYNYNGTNYLVYSSFSSAIASGADVIYYISGTARLQEDLVALQAKDLEVIGLAADRKNALFTYSSSVYCNNYNLTLNNVGVDKQNNGDCAFHCTKDLTITLDNVLATNYAFNLFGGGHSNAAGGNIVIKGDTGPVNSIYTGVSSWQQGHHVGGDIDVIIEDGTFKGTIGNNKDQSGNYIDGNVRITITGGTFGGTVAIGSKSDNSAVRKNAVLTILGGDFTNATIGRTTEATKVSGKDIIITTDEIKSSAKTFNKASNGIVILVPSDKLDALGAETLDSNGYITSIAINQVAGKTSFVNGVAANAIALTAGETYVVTYKTGNAIEFNLNGGVGTVPSTITGNAGDDVTEQMPDGSGFTKANHTFRGWSINKDADTPDDSFVITADGIIVYAVWEAKEQVTIALDANGGTLSENSIKVFYDEETTLPTPYKSKAVFLGWAESATATTGSLTYTAVKGSTASTLYAIYKEVGLEVIYVDTTATKNGDGRSAASPMNDWKAAMSAGSAEGTMYVLMTATIVSKTSTVGNDYGSAKGPFTLTATDPATGEKYNSTAIFSSNGHYSSRSVTYDIPVAALDHSDMHVNASGNNTYFTKNARFIGKGEAIPGTSEVASSRIYIRGRGENGSVASTYYEFDDIDVVTYDIRVLSNSNSNSTTSTVVVNDGTIDKTFALGDSNKYGTVNLIVNGFSGTGKTLTLSGTATVGVLNIVMNNDTAEVANYNYAATPTSTYIVKSTSEGFVKPTTTAGTFEITTEEDNIFANGVKLTKSADNRYALGAAGTYVITYDQTPRRKIIYKANGGEGADVTVTLKEGTVINLSPDAAPFTRTGYKLIGWNMYSNATTPLTALTVGPSDYEFYAIWEEIKYVATFDANGAEGTAPASVKVREGAEITLPTEVALTKEGYSFLGWNTDKNATEALTALTMGTADVTLYAIWKEKTHAVTYNMNGGEGTAPETVQVREGLEIALPTEVEFTKTGYSFLGWAESADANQVLASLTMGTADVTLYAIWGIETYKVTFNANGGNVIGELADMTKTYGVTLELPTDYVLYGTGLEFVGWSENPDADASEVVTEYTENEATAFFAIYNEVGTGNVTPGITDDELADGTYFVITECDDEIDAPEFEIPGTATEIAKVEITLIDAATGEEAELTGEASFTVECDEDLSGKAVVVYHVDTDTFENSSVDGNNVTFTTSSLSTFVIYTVEVEASYILKGQYNIVSGLYNVSLYYNGKEANTGSFGFKYDDSVYAFDSFTYAEGFDSVTETSHDEENAVVYGTWHPTEGAYIGGNDEDILIGTFTFAVANEDYDMDLSAERFTEYKDAEADGETFNGDYYLYTPNIESSLDVVFAPIVTLDVVDSEPITVTYAVSATLVTVREDGETPVSLAKAVVYTANGTKVAEAEIENDETNTASVPFQLELAPGEYKLSVIKNGYLEYVTEFIVEESDVDLGDIEPVAGDIRGNADEDQGDGVIDLADFVRVLRGFEFSELATHVDIDENGIVNVTDLAYVKANFGLSK